MVAVVGNYEPGAKLVTMDNNATAITKGHLLKADTSNGGVVLCTADASEEGPFFVAVETVSATSQNVLCAASGSIVYVKADTAITVGELVEAAPLTAGDVGQFIITSASDADAAIQFKRVVGTYLGHETELFGRAVATDAADGDVIAVLLR